jgi:hypothetical protein
MKVLHGQPHISSSRTALTNWWLKTVSLQNQSQSYFTTGGLTPISSSWHQASWGSWDWLASVGRLNCCWTSPAQSFLASVSSRSMTKIFVLSYTCTCLEMGPPLRRRKGSVLLCRRYVCWTVVSARVYPRCHGVQVTMDSVHPSSLHKSK